MLRVTDPRSAERGSVSRSTLAGRARYRRLKHACSLAARGGSQTRAPLRLRLRRAGDV